MKKAILFLLIYFLFITNIQSQCIGDVVIEGKQRNNSFINISNDSISEFVYSYLIKDDSINYELLIGSEIFIFVNIDTSGYISTIDCINNSSHSDLLFFKLKIILEQLQPFNPYISLNGKHNLYGFAINFKFNKKKVEINY
jgi:hypothetical protein